MAIITSLAQLAGPLDRWFTAFIERSHHKTQTADAVVKAVLLAVNETEAYIADWKQDRRDRERELVLVRLWTDAAVAIRRDDREFAQTLQMKAQYWADPVNWTAADVKRAGIGIRDIAAKARSYLGGAI
jgi:hypothetical protein